MHRKRAEFIYKVWDEWCVKHEVTTFSEREGTRLINYTISRLVEEQKNATKKDVPEEVAPELREGRAGPGEEQPR